MNRSPFSSGKCYKGEGLYMCYISQKSKWTKHRKAFIYFFFFFQEKSHPETEKISSFNMSKFEWHTTQSMKLYFLFLFPMKAIVLLNIFSS